MKVISQTKNGKKEFAIFEAYWSFSGNTEDPFDMRPDSLGESGMQT